MTNLFMDWEFYENGKTIQPISVAIVPEESAHRSSLYLISESATYRAHKSEWLSKHVWPHISSDLINISDHVVSDSDLKAKVYNYISSFDDPQLWAWYGAYDHVCLAQLFGRMIDMPEEIPWYTNDIKTLEVLAKRRALLNGWRLDSSMYPTQDKKSEHHALFDAAHDRDLHKFFMDYITRRLNDD